MNLRDYCKMNTLVDEVVKESGKGLSRQELNAYKDKLAPFMQKMSYDELDAFIDGLSKTRAQLKLEQPK